MGLKQEEIKSLILEAIPDAEISIEDLARIIAKLVGWNGSFTYNRAMPDGTMLKKLDTTKIQEMGWKPLIDIKTGLKDTINEYVNQFKPN